MTRIYTKLGDDGSTGLLFGGRVSKADALIDVVGSVDETVAALGLARASAADEELRASILQIQRELFVVAADLVASPRARDRLEPGISLVSAGMVTDVEQRIDHAIQAHPLPEVFVVPGEDVASASLDLARTVVRRAERRLVEHRRSAPSGAVINPHAAKYLNRVSDLIYALARGAAGPGAEPASH